MLSKRLSDDGFESNSHQDIIEESNSLLGILNLRTASLGDPDGHSQRVAVYSVAVGEQLDLPKQTINTLRAASILHDIGKVGISRKIIEKIGRLTEREFEIIRLHSVIAIRMLENVPELKDTLPMIKHHHERIDGKGYPDGLKGHDIPLGARIISVAETFDILISDVPWRDAMTIDQAIQELRDNSGTQFDPMLIEVFISLIESNKIELPEDIQESPQKIQRKIN